MGRTEREPATHNPRQKRRREREGGKKPITARAYVATIEMSLGKRNPRRAKDVSLAHDFNFKIGFVPGRKLCHIHIHST